MSYGIAPRSPRVPLAQPLAIGYTSQPGETMALGNDGKRLLSRKQVAQRLRITIAHVRSLQTRGVLRGTKRGGCWWFEQRDADSAERTLHNTRALDRKDGDLAARIFDDLERGDDLIKLVQRYREPPHVVRSLMADYEEARGARWIPGALAKKCDALLADRYNDGIPWQQLDDVLAALVAAGTERLFQQLQEAK